MFFSTKFFFPKGPPLGFFPKFLKFFQNFKKLLKLPYFGLCKVFKPFFSFFFFWKCSTFFFDGFPYRGTLWKEVSCWRVGLWSWCEQVDQGGPARQGSLLPRHEPCAQRDRRLLRLMCSNRDQFIKECDCNVLFDFPKLFCNTLHWQKLFLQW